MVNRIQNRDKVPSWVIVVVVIFVLIVSFSIFQSNDESDSSGIHTSDDNYPPLSAIPNTVQEPEDNRLRCPAGNKTDSGKKTDDWFECSDIKAMMDGKPDGYNIDCSQKKNYDKEKIYFAISTLCKKDEWIITKTSCEEQGGIIRPIIHSQSYPSLNEYYFNSISAEFKNLGCTKLNPEDYSLIYALYQNGKILASKIDSEYLGYVSSLWAKEDSLIYPEAWLMPSLGFGERYMLPEAVQTASPKNFTFKVCLIDTPKKTVIACNQADFDIGYESEYSYP